MHLDGLADTADGLGSRRPADGALEVMRRGDVGPFGVVTLVLVLLAQVAALAAAPAAPVALAVALLVSRAALPLLCRRGRPGGPPRGPRRPGRGHGRRRSRRPPRSWARSSSRARSAGRRTASAGWWRRCSRSRRGRSCARHCVRRFGGITGDVLGACVEVTGTAALVFLGFL